jgi:hypothetical protein
MAAKATATGTIESKNWDQQPYAEHASAPALAHASGVDLYHGGLEAEVTWQGVSLSRDDGSGVTVGLQRVVGRLDGHAGSFVLQLAIATEPGGASSATVSVVPGSGTDMLAGLRGGGGLSWQPGQPHWSYTLDYELA